MKILFLLFALVLNLSMYLLPFGLSHLLLKRLSAKQGDLLAIPNGQDKHGLLFPFAIWFVLYLFDSTQKTIKQIIFIDPLLLGLLVTLLFILRERLANFLSPHFVSIIISLFGALGAIVLWYTT